MKKLTTLLVVMATLAGNAAFAQSNNYNNNNNMGRGAQQSSTYATNDEEFSWGIALGGLAVLGVVVGITASAAASNPSSFSH